MTYVDLIWAIVVIFLYGMYRRTSVKFLLLIESIDDVRAKNSDNPDYIIVISEIMGLHFWKCASTMSIFYKIIIYLKYKIFGKGLSKKLKKKGIDIETIDSIDGIHKTIIYVDRDDDYDNLKLMIEVFGLKNTKVIKRESKEENDKKEE